MCSFCFSYKNKLLSWYRLMKKKWLGKSSDRFSRLTIYRSNLSKNNSIVLSISDSIEKICISKLIALTEKVCELRYHFLFPKKYQSFRLSSFHRKIIELNDRVISSPTKYSQRSDYFSSIHFRSIDFDPIK